MGPFFRVIKLSLRYKWAIVASAANALLIGVLWGVSITTVYPFVEVVLRGETVSTWLDGQIDKARAGVERSRVEIEKFQEQLDKDPSGASGLKQSKLIVLRSRHAAEEKALGYFEWLRPSLQGRVPSTPFATLAVVMVFLVLATMLKGLCLVLNTLLVSRVADRTVMDMRRDFYRAALTMDQKTLDKHGTASLMSQIVHNTQLVGEGLRTLYGTSVREPLKMLACLVIAGMISWQLLLLSLLVAPLGGALIHYLSHRTKRIALHECAGFATMLETILETLNGIKIVRIYNHERGERRRFKKDSSALYHAGRRIALSDALVKPITELTGIVTIVLAILVGAYLVLNEQTHFLGVRFCSRPLSSGALFVFYAMLAGVADPARKMGDIYTILVRASAACKALFAVFDVKSEITSPPHPQPVPLHSQKIRFDNVRFAYVPSCWALDGVTLDIPFGQAVALVGENGCGKSTTLNLLTRFYDPQEGSVSIDGVDLRDVSPRKLRRQIALVTQDPILFRGTVWENIAYSMPHASEEEILNAARQAHVDDYIHELSLGYQTQVGDRGNALSGGQRQRVTLARAILANPRILILDEATSQIDQHSEDLVQDSLQGFLKGRTTILVTHRPSTIRLAQRVVVMDRGKIVRDLSAADYLAELESRSSAKRAA